MTSQILLLDLPRSACDLLERILSRQPRRQFLNSPHSQCQGIQVEWLTSEAWEAGLPDEKLADYKQSVEKCTEKWREALSESQQNKQILMVRDHPFSAVSPDIIVNFIETMPTGQDLDLKNFTLIPDDLLLTPGTIPILTIRDPRLTVISAYRVLNDFGLAHGSGRPNFIISTTPAWLKFLYNFFLSNGIEPLVVDADDFLTDDTTFLRSLTEKVGLDPELLHLKWELPTDKERAEFHPMFYASQKKLIESEGIKIERSSRNIDFDAEMEKIEKDFGKEDLLLVKEMIDLAMPYYQWLYERRFKG